MKTAKELHEEAMSFYEESLVLKFKGKEEERLALLRKAFILEKEAAMLLKERYDLEPTRSKLFASCATIACHLSEYREGEKMIALGLAGDPASPVLEELRDLFDKVNFHRHLETRGITLSNDEFRFTLGSGDEVMKGIARGDEVMTRIEGIEALYSRTVQRMNEKPYQSRGRASEEENKVIQLYYKTPEAASFAITFKIPQSDQQLLFPKNLQINNYVDEMLQCIDLIDQGKIKELKDKIPDESYFQSFMINARKIAPDGSNIKSVGFTVYRNNEEEIHPFSIIQSRIALDSAEITTKEENEKREKTIVTGKLLASDTPRKFITVVTETKQYKKNGIIKKSKFTKYKIKFIIEAQRELVRDNYEEDVSVEVWKYHDNSLEFIDLKRS